MSKKSRFLTVFSLIIISTLIIFLPVFFVGCGEKPEITDISFSEEEYYITIHHYQYIDVNVSPSNINLTGRLLWTSADPVIARVDGFGKVEGLNYGKTTITCSVVNSDLSASFDVTVGDGEIIYMEVNNKVTEKIYYVGDYLDLNELKVNIIYQSGLKEEIALDDLTLTYPSPLKEGAVLTIEYKQFKRQFELFVFPLELSKIEIISLFVRLIPVISHKSSTILSVILSSINFTKLLNLVISSPKSTIKEQLLLLLTKPFLIICQPKFTLS